jgi:PAS domain S-box-containing protein
VSRQDSSGFERLEALIARLLEADAAADGRADAPPKQEMVERLYATLEELLVADEDRRRAVDSLHERVTREAAEAAQRQIEGILESITDAFFSVDRGWRFTYVNREAEQLLRRPREELLGQGIWELYSDLERTIVHEQYQRAMREGVTVAFETFYEPLGGWFEVHAYAGPEGLSVFFHEITARKAAEEALRESEARYRTLFESIDEGFCLIEMLFDDEGRPVDYRFLEGNPAWEQHTGLKDAIGRTARELLPDLEEHWFEVYGRVAQTGEPIRFERGSAVMGRWFDVFAFRVEEPERRRVAILFAEISEQKRAGQQERVFRRMIEESRAEIYAFDAATLHFLRVNRGARENLGYSLAELRRLTPLDLKPEFTAESFAQLLEPLRRRERQELRFETVHRRRDGSEYPVDVHLQLFDGTPKPVFVGLILDVTERMLAEAREVELIREQTAREAAEKSERDAQFLASFSHGLTTSLDTEQTLRRVTGMLVPTLADWCVVELLADAGEIEHVEAKAADPRKEAALRRMVTRYSHDASMAWVNVKAVIESGTPVLQERIPAELLDRSAPDEEVRSLLHDLAPTSAITAPLITGDRVRGVLSLGYAGREDRLGTGEVALVEELARRAALALDNAMLFEKERRAHEQATAAVRTRDEVLGVVAHDLRTPLSAISIFAALLEDSVASEEDRQRAATILRSAEQMDRLIQDLLDVARLEAGYLHLAPEAHEPAALVGEAVEMLQESAAAQGLRLEDSVLADLPAVRADSHRVRQVLSNLVANALKATPRGGSVRLGAKQVGEEVVFFVRDTGPGIPQEKLPYLFQRFWQARRGDRTGAGLGLAIAKGIVEAHRGRIWVESEPGTGSTFFFSLPVAGRAEVPPPEALPRPVPAAEPAAAPPASAEEPIRVLLVDDHPFVRRGLENTLRRSPRIRVVAEASTGEEALEKVAELGPDVVVMDLVMEGMGGLEAIRRLTAAYPQTRVLALTSEAEEEALLPVLAAGGHGFVPKTRAHDTLVRAIETVARGEVYLHPSAAKLLLRGYRNAEQRANEPLERLSAQELALIRLVAEGYNSKEIGKKLFLARSTVDTYRSQLMQKLGLSHRSELVKFALRAGMLGGE